MEREDVINQALVEVLKHHCSGVGIGTGVGKTKLALMHMQHFYKPSTRFLVVAPKVSILQSWKDEAKKWGMEHLLFLTDFSTYLSLEKQRMDYEVVYLDESHSLLDSNRAWLSAYKGKIVGLSGTPPRYHHSEKGKMVDDFCPTVFEYGIDAAVTDEILNDYRIIIHPLNLSTKRDFWVKSKTGGFWSSEQLNYEYWTKRIDNAHSKKEQQILRILRMKALQSYKTKLNYARGLFNNCINKCICFTDSQDAADSLCAYSFHSNNPDSGKNLELFKEGKILRLSAVNQLSEGVNIPGLKRAIILSSYSGNSPRTSQKLGRCLRISTDQIATIEVLVYTGTQDEVWLNSVLSQFDSSKISYHGESELIKI